MIGNASVIALGEAVHFAAEPLEFRNLLFRYLVEQKGFTAIAVESGIVESRTVHDYVQGGPGDLESTLAQGLSWTFDRLPQNRELVRWLREFNSNSKGGRKVNFYGFDVPGSPGNARANRGMETALVEALEFLDRVDARAGAEFHARVDPMLNHLRFDLEQPANAPGYYGHLRQSERDGLTVAIADLISLLARREARYIAQSTEIDYRWSYRAAIGARQIDDRLRQVSVDWRPSQDGRAHQSEQASFLFETSDIRDRAQADNLEWIASQEGPHGKILVFGHRFHVSTAPVKRTFGGQEREQEVMGTYLRRRMGHELVTIGNLIGTGRIGGLRGCETLGRAPRQAPQDSIDAEMRAIGRASFLLDLRTAPASALDWLNREHPLAHGLQVCKLVPSQAFDILFYLDAVTPASGD